MIKAMMSIVSGLNDKSLIIPVVNSLHSEKSVG